jgi:myo-inositol-1(or 4)-monophosphatase
MNDYSAISKVLLSVMHTAGVAILKIQKDGFTVEKKGHDDIVTVADLLANDILRTELTTAFPDYGWLSEESVDDPARLNCKRVWIVDPIDGTREFAQGIPEYAISVALVEDGKPIVASVYNPAAQKLFFATAGGGAFLGNNSIHCRDRVQDGKLTLLASRSEFKKGKWDRFNTQDVQPIGSIAYKLALIAAGLGDATFSLSPKNEWDIAAGVLLVHEAGGIVTNKQGEVINFNQKKVLVDGIVATSSISKDLVFKLITM